MSLHFCKHSSAGFTLKPISPGFNFAVSLPNTPRHQTLFPLKVYFCPVLAAPASYEPAHVPPIVNTGGRSGFNSKSISLKKSHSLIVETSIVTSSLRPYTPTRIRGFLKLECKRTCGVFRIATVGNTIGKEARPLGLI